MYSVLNTFLEYIYFYISRNITSSTFLLVFKTVKNLSVFLKMDSHLPKKLVLFASMKDL